MFTMTERRSGIADFECTPHFFECPSDEGNENGYSEFFLLTPLVPKVFTLAMEDWEIFVQYYAVFEAGNARADSHPLYCGTAKGMSNCG
jgi:hypothetical protein